MEAEKPVMEEGRPLLSRALPHYPLGDGLGIRPCNLEDVNEGPCWLQGISLWVSTGGRAGGAERRDLWVLHSPNLLHRI